MLNLNIDLKNEIESSQESEDIKQMALEVLGKVNEDIDSDEKIISDLKTEIYKQINESTSDNEVEE